MGAPAPVNPRYLRTSCFSPREYQARGWWTAGPHPAVCRSSSWHLRYDDDRRASHFAAHEPRSWHFNSRSRFLVPAGLMEPDQTPESRHHDAACSTSIYLISFTACLGLQPLPFIRAFIRRRSRWRLRRLVCRSLSDRGVVGLPGENGLECVLLLGSKTIACPWGPIPSLS